jgi:SAM-dependent methyltransferase
MNPAIADSISLMRNDWNRRAREDANYYVAFVRPDQAEDQFSGSAAEVIRELESELHRLDSFHAPRRRALEIGCGPGRLMLPLSRHFDEIYGVDISDEMIRIARRRLQSVPHARVLVNCGADLSLFRDNCFSFVYSYIVFQHIPEKEIVFNYLREIKRVLTPGGVTRFQLRGAPPSKAGLDDPITWKGCVVLDSEIVDFACQAGLELVGLSGEGTQYLWVTLRKPPQPALDAVTSCSSASTRIPQRGPGASISLWIRNAPATADLTTLMAQINGQLVRGSYLSPIDAQGGCQMNVTLPRNLPLGDAEVALIHRGEVVSSSRVVTIEPAPPVPRIAVICDAKDAAMEMRSDSGGLKVLIQDLEEAEAIAFQVAGKPVDNVDVSSTNRILEQYLFSLLLPPDTPNGPQALAITYQGNLVYQGEVEIRSPWVAPPAVILDAVTSAVCASTTVPHRGPGAAISLWIRNAPASSDLSTLTARIHGQQLTGSYLSGIGPDGGCQLNVQLPKNLPFSSVEVALLHYGEVIIPPRSITIEQKLMVPRVIAVCDPDDATLELRNSSGGLKVVMEDIEDPHTIGFLLAGIAVPVAEVVCADEVLDRYQFLLRVPPEVGESLRTLEVTCGGSLVHSAEVQIANGIAQRTIAVS